MLRLNRTNPTMPCMIQWEWRFEEDPESAAKVNGTAKHTIYVGVFQSDAGELVIDRKSKWNGWRRLNGDDDIKAEARSSRIRCLVLECSGATRRPGRSAERQS